MHRLILLYLVLFCMACKKPVDSTVESSTNTGNIESRIKFSLAPKDIIEIPIDTLSLNYSLYPGYYANDTIELYITANENINGLDFYDLNKKRLVKRNIFDRVGPHGILSIRKFFIKSLDSIYIYSDQDLRILLVNYKGDVLNRIKVEQPWMANLLQPFLVKDNVAFFGYMNYGDNRAQTGYKTMRAQDLVRGITREFGPMYPQVFEKYLFYNFLPFYTYGHNNNFVVRFGSLSQIYNYDISTDSTTVFQMKSVWEVLTIQPDKKANEFREMDKDHEGLEQGEYLGVYYDRYNHVYYSIFSQGIPVLSIHGKKQDFMDKPISIIIFNEQFEYCGETLLEKNTYFNNFLPTKRGLLIPMSHPKNPGNDENKLQFQVFKLAPIN